MDQLYFYENIVDVSKARSSKRSLSFVSLGGAIRRLSL